MKRDSRGWRTSWRLGLLGLPNRKVVTWWIMGTVSNISLQWCMHERTRQELHVATSQLQRTLYATIGMHVVCQCLTTKLEKECEKSSFFATWWPRKQVYCKAPSSAWPRGPWWSKPTCRIHLLHTWLCQGVRELYSKEPASGLSLWYSSQIRFLQLSDGWDNRCW